MKRPSPGDVIAQHYRLTRRLEEGIASVVFAAENVFTGKTVAVKWFLPELLCEREVSLSLLREAQRNGAIVHPNVAHVLDVGRHEGSLFLVTELLDGKSLSALLTQSPVDPYAFIMLMMPVLRGVQAAHDAGVLHRDLNPDHIFLSVDAHGLGRNIKVLDFGGSKLIDGSLLRERELSRADAVHATPQFMAPEQLRDPPDCDERSDIYALGVIFYRALSGVCPFDGETLSELAMLVSEGAIPLQQRIPHLHLGLCGVVMRALESNPKHRYASVAELASALEPYLRRPEACLRPRLDSAEHHAPRSESLVEPASSPSLMDLAVPPPPAGARERGASPGSGRLRPPPPPPPRHPSAQRGANTGGETPDLCPSDSQESSAYAQRARGPITPKHALPPPPPPPSAHRVDPHIRRASD